ncbi:SixA phosphatase family protein [Niabella soli]|uniref:Phosphohistidine phosphatase n=1 Tax=Niabella soli DSM 19437 TaxID=929713 RepID=W0F8T3_9BACT|nr:histidine phosphatase family protein [Niabella soli]AHF17776.1 hypothetical protein NIASO_13995 [Niabella soli DSM 19437]
MKTLIIIRHSKAEKGSGRDIDRHLTETGHRDAIQVAELLKSKGYEIDKILSSNSERTKRTTQLFSGVLGIDNDAVFFFESLYLADVLGISETIELYGGSKANTLAVVGHNPGVTNFVTDLTHTSIDNIPTSGVAVMEVDLEDWAQLGSAGKKLVATFSPKDL